MNRMMKLTTITFVLAVASFANAAGIGTNVSADITVSTNWTLAGSPYHLTTIVAVKNGATLTIDPGVVIASFAADQGTFLVCQGAKIYSNGTATAPVIFTSAEDVATWTGSQVTRDGVPTPGYPNGFVTSIQVMGDPKTGVERHASNEWGNVCLLGQAYISASSQNANGADPVVVSGRTNTAVPVPPPATTAQTNRHYIEGLVPDDTKPTYFGGNNDDDNSGALHYTISRYGGKVIGIGNELNGFSMGGLGRQTVVDHIENFNTIDDGVETWGGTVCYKYVLSWNQGDDGFDTDEGWRGKLQFFLCVEGASLPGTARGSGNSDNIFEADGAENSDAQPCSTYTVYNATGIGQPNSGRGGTAWRDNNRCQYRNCVFIDVGRQVVRADWTDGDNASGYGYNGTLTWDQTWTTPYTYRQQINRGTLTDAQLDYMYQTQSAGGLGANSGYLAEMTSTVCYNCNFAGDEKDGNYVAANQRHEGDAYAEAIRLGVFLGSTTTDGSPSSSGNFAAVSPASNPAKDNIIATKCPIVSYTRDPNPPAAFNPTPFGVVQNVIHLDPRAANDALTSAQTAPNDGFFTPVNYRGAFSKDQIWALGWTTADAYGYFSDAQGHKLTNNVTDPTATLQMTATTSFPTVTGVVYTVEQSSDGRAWTPIGTVTGTGSTMYVTDLKTFDNSKLYRVIAN